MPEIGLNYYKARIYAPTIGRFMQTDPIGYDAGMNLYAYTGGDPINRSDPGGLSYAATRIVRVKDSNSSGSSGSGPGSPGSDSRGPTPTEPGVWTSTDSGPWVYQGPAPGLNSSAFGSGGAARNVVSDVLNHEIGEDIVVIAKKVPKPVQDFISNHAINYDCAFIGRSSCSTSDYINVAGALLTGSIGANTAVEGASKGFTNYGVGRVGQVRFFQNRLIVRLDVDKPITHLNVEGNIFGVKFNFHLPRF